MVHRFDVDSMHQVPSVEFGASFALPVRVAQSGDDRAE
jgi:hypothetical protein